MRIQLFWERLSEKVHATILEGILGDFKCTVFQRNLKELYGRPLIYVWECWRKVIKVGSTATVVRNSVLIISHITFRDCRVHFILHKLSRNSCIYTYDWNHTERGFSSCDVTEHFLHNSRTALSFLTLFSVTVSIYDRTLFLVFDTLYPYNLLGTGHEIEMTCPIQLGLFPDPAGVQYVTTGSWRKSMPHWSTLHQ